ncbi:MAG: transposase, partial [Chthoniobacterales bacterium]
MVSVIFYYILWWIARVSSMPRQASIEFAGAMYHVMARGNRRAAIVQDDQDRVTFLRTLAEACERTGFRLHAYVLMTNHYDLLVETPQANLARGMGAKRIHAADRHEAPARGACFRGPLQVDC